MKQTYLLKIKKIALDIDHNMAFGGKSKGNKHLSRVVKIADFLASKLKADPDVVKVAAYLHDAALPTNNDDDYAANKKLIKGLLEKSGIMFSSDFIEKVAEAVASHEGTKIPSTLAAQIVHDADVIEKTGLLGVIRHTWKLTNQGKINPNNITDSEIKTVIDHIKWRKTILQTSIAKEIVGENDCDVSITTLRKIIPVISMLAFQGVVTEEIAKKIKSQLNKKQFLSLSNQLNLKYLWY